MGVAKPPSRAAKDTPSSKHLPIFDFPLTAPTMASMGSTNDKDSATAPVSVMMNEIRPVTIMMARMSFPRVSARKKG